MHRIAVAVARNVQPPHPSLSVGVTTRARRRHSTYLHAHISLQSRLSRSLSSTGAPPPAGPSPSNNGEPHTPPTIEVSGKEAARLKRIAKIKEEIKRGYFYELGQVNRTKCKLFEADKELLPPSQARKVPSFDAESLLGVTHQFATLLTQAQSQVSLVALSFRDSGFRVLPDWIRPFQQEFARLPAMKVLQVSFEDKTWLKLLKFLLLNGQKSSIERERHGQSFLRFGSTEEIREGMGIDNRMVGYVFLVDKTGRMRWRGTGRPSEEEIGSMLKCAHELYEESTRIVEADSGKLSNKLNKRH